jgi:hypothetical protein
MLTLIKQMSSYFDEFRPSASSSNEAPRVSLRIEPTKLVVNDNFQLKDETIDNLPKMPKLSDGDENIQQRVMDIITGTVARGTSAQWGVFDEDTKETLCGEENPHVRILTIREGLHPDLNLDDDPSAYDVTFVYIHNDGETPDENTLNAFNNAQLFKRILFSLELATKKAKKLARLSERNLPSFTRSITRDLYDFWKSPFLQKNKGEFASVLLFCKNCQFEFAVLSVAYGKNDQLFLHERADEKFVSSPVLRYVDHYGNFQSTDQSSPIFRLFLTYLMKSRRMPEDQAHQKTTLILQELQELSVQRKLKKNDVLSYFFHYIEIPCFDWVGNLEFIHGSQVMRDEFNELEQVREMSILKNGACTLNMALAMMQLRKRSPVFYLHNAGGIGGCRCYSNAASSNDMITLKAFSALLELQELLQPKNIFHEFQMFNSNHCLPELNPERYESYTHSQFLFIDYKTAAFLFTERNGILMINPEFEDIRQSQNRDFLMKQNEANETLKTRWKKYMNSKQTANHKKQPKFENDDFDLLEEDSDKEEATVFNYPRGEASIGKAPRGQASFIDEGFRGNDKPSRETGKHGRDKFDFRYQPGEDLTFEHVDDEEDLDEYQPNQPDEDAPGKHGRDNFDFLYQPGEDLTTEHVDKEEDPNEYQPNQLDEDDGGRFHKKPRRQNLFWYDDL